MTATERPPAPEPYGHSGDRSWEEIAADPDFRELRRRLRSFAFPMTGLFLAWYLLYVLLASYAPAFMAVKLAGNITVGLVFGLLEFVSTFVITFVYVRFAERRLDPLAAELRERIEGHGPVSTDVEGRDVVGRDVESRDIESRDIEEDVR